MAGYELNDQDIKAMLNWLKKYHPKDANPEYARAMLIEMKLMYRSIGLSNPDALEKLYEEFKNVKE